MRPFLSELAAQQWLLFNASGDCCVYVGTLYTLYVLVYDYASLSSEAVLLDV